MIYFNICIYSSLFLLKIYFFFSKEETQKVHNDSTKFTLTIQGKLSRKHKDQTLYTVIKLNITGLYCNNYIQHCMHTLIIHLNCLQNMPRKSPLPGEPKKILKKKSKRKKSKFVLFILKTMIFPFPILFHLGKKYINRAFAVVFLLKLLNLRNNRCLSRQP